MAFMKKSSSEGTKGLISPISGLCMTLNSAIGSGVLALPLTFNQSGIILSSVLIFFFSLLLYTTVAMLLDLSTRYWAKYDDSREALLPDHEVVHPGQLCLKLPNNQKWGMTWFALYQLGIIIMQFVTVMAYANVVAGSMAQLVHFKMQDGDACMDTAHLSTGCSHAYEIWLAVYIVICSCMAFVDLKYQSILQNLFAVYRYVVIIILIGFAAFIIHRDGISPTAHITETSASGFGALLPTLTFSLFIHAGLALLYQPVRNKNKTLRPMFFAVLVICACLYACVACLNALAYGTDLASIITQTYFSDKRLDSTFERALIQVISWYPPLALTFATSNQAFPLAEAIKEFLPAKFRPKYIIKIACRWVAIIVPAIIVFGVRSFSALLSLSSFGGYLVCFIVPAGLVLTTSDQRDSSSPFHSFWSRKWYGWCVLLWGLFAVIYTAIFFNA